jgi:2-polyprenyl-3-methyl-5-hydroxy-6-metoxy-1,4-benzoquinol methylase
MLKRIAKRASTELSDRGRKLASAFKPYSAMEYDKAALDAQYAAGQWDYLGSIDEAPRFGAVSAYCRLLATGGSLLEIGCGTGLLVQQLDRARYKTYTGVDLSSEAISRASSLANDHTTFVAADARTFVPSEAVDLIVFNEVLEYFADPLGLVRRYEPFLRPEGSFVVSLYDEPFTVRTRRIWRMLHGRYETVARTRVQTLRHYTWDIEALRGTM